MKKVQSRARILFRWMRSVMKSENWMAALGCSRSSEALSLQRDFLIKHQFKAALLKLSSLSLNATLSDWLLLTKSFFFLIKRDIEFRGPGLWLLTIPKLRGSRAGQSSCTSSCLRPNPWPLSVTSTQCLLEPCPSSNSALNFWSQTNKRIHGYKKKKSSGVTRTTVDRLLALLACNDPSTSCGGCRCKCLLLTLYLGNWVFTQATGIHFQTKMTFS